MRNLKRFSRKIKRFARQLIALAREPERSSSDTLGTAIRASHFPQNPRRRPKIQPRKGCYRRLNQILLRPWLRGIAAAACFGGGIVFAVLGMNVLRDSGRGPGGLLLCWGLMLVADFVGMGALLWRRD
jgi:hypothetical protein